MHGGRRGPSDALCQSGGNGCSGYLLVYLGRDTLFTESCLKLFNALVNFNVCIVQFIFCLPVEFFGLA